MRHVAAACLVLLLVSCSSDEPMEEPVPTAPLATAASPTESSDLFPDVLAATATQSDNGTWSFSVTLSSPYDTPERYADAWRVLAPDGTELAVRVLAHDHANEQPFTRSVSGVAIPDDIDAVTIEGRDQLSGWGGATVEVSLAPS